MNRFFWWFAIGFFCVVPFRGAYILWRDLNHPETWDRWETNPCVYGPMWGIVLFAGVALAVQIYLAERKRR